MKWTRTDGKVGIDSQDRGAQVDIVDANDNVIATHHFVVDPDGYLIHFDSDEAYQEWQDRW